MCIYIYINKPWTPNIFPLVFLGSSIQGLYGWLKGVLSWPKSRRRRIVVRRKPSRRFVDPEEFTEFAYAFICSLEAVAFEFLGLVVGGYKLQLSSYHYKEPY